MKHLARLLANGAHRAGCAGLVAFALVSLLSPFRTDGLYARQVWWRLDSPSEGMVPIGALYGWAALSLGLWAAGRWLKSARLHLAVASDPEWPARNPLMLTAPLGLLTGLMLVRLCCSTHRAEMILTLIDAATLITTFLFVRFECSSARPAMRFVAAVATLQALFGLRQFALQSEPGVMLVGRLPLDPAVSGVSVVGDGAQRFLRAYGLTAHPNILGGMLALGLIAAVGLWLSESPRAARSARRAWLAPIAVLSAGLAVSFSRAAWLGAAGGLGALAVCVCLEGGETGWRERLGRWPSRLARLTPALGLIVLIGGVGVVSQPRLFWMRATGTGSSFEAESTRNRVTGWQISWQVIRQRWLWGVGTDQYLKGVSEALGAPAEGWMLVHNQPLLLWAENGLLAFVAWLALGLGMVGWAWRQAVRCRSPDGLKMGAAWMASIQIIGLFDYYYAPAHQSQAPLWLGLVCGAWAVGFNSSCPAPADRPAGQDDNLR